MSIDYKRLITEARVAEVVNEITQLLKSPEAIVIGELKFSRINEATGRVSFEVSDSESSDSITVELGENPKISGSGTLPEFFEKVTKALEDIEETGFKTKVKFLS